MPRASIRIIVSLLFFSSLGCIEPGRQDPATQIIVVDDPLVDVGGEFEDIVPSPDAVHFEEVGVEEDVFVYVEPWDCAPELSLDGVSYAHLAEVDGVALREGLRAMVDEHRSLGYDLARNEMFRTIDVDEDRMIECIYTGRKVLRDGTRTPDGFNTEHTWPQSRGAGDEPARSDIHHLFPIDEVANEVRGNYEFGWVSCSGAHCPWSEGGSYLGPGTDGRSVVFEVRSERRGDVARAILYVALRYGFPIAAREEAVLRQWHCEDPPDALERRRNDLIEERQRNRNPFVDRPDFLDRLGAFQ